MKPFVFGSSGTASVGGLLERIEILRASLRWSTRLDRAEIQSVLGQCNVLRDEVMRFSRSTRFADARALEPLGPVPEQPAVSRRQALLDRNFVFEGVFGDNPKLLESLEIAERAAPSDLPVLIRGESGTGKELMARVVHSNGKRADGPFISVNCGAIPHELLESELFGHRKGAFTGASADRKGKFESADGGTIFLDEIGELPLHGQVKLLRVLQSQEIQRVGSDAPIRVDARIVAATNRDLLQMVREGRFREDLYYRLCVIEVNVPPLRERRDELPLLIDFFCVEAAEKLERSPLALTARLQGFLLGYCYPGNIRELRNVIYRMSCLANATADLEHLPSQLRADADSHCQESDGAEATTGWSLSEVRKAASETAEKRFLVEGLRNVDGRVMELAKRSGMNRSHLQTLLKKHGLRSRDFRGGASTRA